MARITDLAKMIGNVLRALKPNSTTTIFFLTGYRTSDPKFWSDSYAAVDRATPSKILSHASGKICL